MDKVMKVHTDKQISALELKLNIRLPIAKRALNKPVIK